LSHLRGYHRSWGLLVTLSLTALPALLVVVSERLTQYAPAPLLIGSAVYLVIENPVVRRGERLKFRVVNEGSRPVFMGLDYRVERMSEGGAWVTCTKLTPQFYPMVLVRLGPGESRAFEVRVEGVPPGEYRIVKPVSLQGGPKERILLEGRFRVVG